MIIIEYDWYFAGNAHFNVYPNNNLTIKYNLDSCYTYKIVKQNDFFYCSLIKDNSFFFLGKFNYFCCDLNLPIKPRYAKDNMVVTIIEKLLFCSKEEDYSLIEKSFAVQPLCCFHCGKSTLNPNYPFGYDCGEIYGQNSTRMA